MTQNIRKSKNLYKILGPVGSRLITELSQSKKTVFSSKEECPSNHLLVKS